MILERTHYYAKPGKAEEVLAMRRKACDVRLLIGIQAGTVQVKADPAADGPDVSWECSFPDRTAHKRDLDARAASAEFEAVRAEMRALIERFERLCEERVSTGGWRRDHFYAGREVTPRECEFESAGRMLKGYLYLPPDAGPFPCMIYNHGSGLAEGGHEDAALPGIPALLNSWGIACFFPHRHGYGFSPGPHWRADCPAEMFSDEYNRQLIARLDRESDDVLAALRFLRTLPEIMPDRIGVMGSSFGGVNTLLAVSKEPSFRCGVEFAGAAMNWDRNPALAAHMIEAAAKAEMPVYYIQAKNDFSVRPTYEIASSLLARQHPFQSKVFPPFGFTPTEGHVLAGRGPLIWSRDVRLFLERFL